LAHLVEQTTDVFQPIAAGKDIRLVVNGAESLCLVNADQTRMSQVLHNLLNNALTHTPTGGQITLSIVQKAERVLLNIEDTGSGIAAEHLPYVFDRFYRADAARSRTKGGSGLGLAIVKAIVEKHHGQVSVASEGVSGKGTLFTIQLPMIVED
ncbi:MAG: GHKL domain-containing protein, partial [Burkholderiales bacterium]|nr:GHKL domain-containing protein [Anaerolineae bacterium]